MKVSLQLDTREAETHFGKRRQLLIFIGVPDYVCQNISIAGIQAPDSHVDGLSECSLNLRESLWKWCIIQTLSQPWFTILLAEQGKCLINILYSSSYRLCNNYHTWVSLKKLQNISSQKLQSRGSVHPTRECFSSKPATLSVTSQHHTSSTFDHLPTKKKNMSFNWMNPRHLFHKITLSWIIAEWDSAGSSSPDEDFYEDEEAD